jgi:hypothetical protein
MTELQEAILDALMVADAFGNYIEPGPLQEALEALQKAGLTRCNNPSAALGYPPLLCAAIEGASKTIRNVDDRRTLGISLFTEIPPRSRRRRLSRTAQTRAVLWSLKRVPPLCEPPGHLAGEVVDLLAQHLGGEPPEAPTVERLSDGLNREIERVDEPEREFDPRRLALSAHYFALHALRQDHRGDDPSDNARHVVRDVARLAGLVQGLPAAIPYCVGLARTLGM